MTISGDHLIVDIDTETATVTSDAPGIDLGIPGPPGPGSTGAAASTITVTPVGNIASTNVQAALAELDTEKPTQAYVDSHGVYVSPTPPADPTRWAIWVDTS